MRATRTLAAGFVVAVVGAGSAAPTWSQAYPSRPIQIIVAYAAGGRG